MTPMERLIGRVFKEVLAQDAGRWITIHPGGKGGKNNNEQGKGVPVLIDDETGKILGGMGGRFTGQKISEIKKKKADPKVATPPSATPGPVGGATSATTPHGTAEGGATEGSAPATTPTASKKLDLDTLRDDYGARKKVIQEEMEGLGGTLTSLGQYKGTDGVAVGITVDAYLRRAIEDSPTALEAKIRDMEAGLLKFGSNPSDDELYTLRAKIYRRVLEAKTGSRLTSEERGITPPVDPATTPTAPTSHTATTPHAYSVGELERDPGKLEEFVKSIPTPEGSGISGSVFKTSGGSTFVTPVTELAGRYLKMTPEELSREVDRLAEGIELTEMASRKEYRTFKKTLVEKILEMKGGSYGSSPTTPTTSPTSPSTPSTPESITRRGRKKAEPTIEELSTDDTKLKSFIRGFTKETGAKMTVGGYFVSSDGIKIKSSKSLFESSKTLIESTPEDITEKIKKADFLLAQSKWTKAQREFIEVQKKMAEKVLTMKGGTLPPTEPTAETTPSSSTTNTPYGSNSSSGSESGSLTNASVKSVHDRAVAKAAEHMERVRTAPVSFALEYGIDDWGMVNFDVLEARINSGPGFAGGIAFRVRDSAERHLKSVKSAMSSLSESERKDFIAKMKSAVEEVMMDPEVHPATRFPKRVLGKILSGGRFKTQVETGSSRGAMDKNRRKCIDYASSGYSGTDERERPIYGFMWSKETKADANWYGEYTAHFKQDLKKRTTFTTGDSLDYGAIASPISGVSTTGIIGMAEQAKFAKFVHLYKTSGDLKGAVRKVFRTPHTSDKYTEFQYHGGVTLDDIDFIEVPSKREEEACRRKYPKYAHLFRYIG